MKIHKALELISTQLARIAANNTSVLTPVPVVSSVLPSQRVDQDKLTHLSVSSSCVSYWMSSPTVSWTSLVYVT